MYPSDDKIVTKAGSLPKDTMNILPNSTPFIGEYIIQKDDELSTETNLPPFY